MNDFLIMNEQNMKKRPHIPRPQGPRYDYDAFGRLHYFDPNDDPELWADDVIDLIEDDDEVKFLSSTTVVGPQIPPTYRPTNDNRPLITTLGTIGSGLYDSTFDGRYDARLVNVANNLDIIDHYETFRNSILTSPRYTNVSFADFFRNTQWKFHACEFGFVVARVTVHQFLRNVSEATQITGCVIESSVDKIVRPGELVVSNALNYPDEIISPNYRDSRSYVTFNEWVPDSDEIVVRIFVSDALRIEKKDDEPSNRDSILITELMRTRGEMTFYRPREGSLLIPLTMVVRRNVPGLTFHGDENLLYEFMRSFVMLMCTNVDLSEEDTRKEAKQIVMMTRLEQLIENRYGNLGPSYVHDEDDFVGYKSGDYFRDYVDKNAEDFAMIYTPREFPLELPKFAIHQRRSSGGKENVFVYMSCRAPSSLQRRCTEFDSFTDAWIATQNKIREQIDASFAYNKRRSRKR